MKAIGAQTLGDLNSLALVEVPVPEAGANQVRVRVMASSINPADFKMLRRTASGRFLHAGVTPLIPGYDVSGVVDAVGTAVSDLREGDTVFGHLPFGPTSRQGACAEFVTMDARSVAKKPDGVDHFKAAGAATAGLTALQALRDKGNVKEQSRVLILGAGGGVGSLAVGIARRLGAHVTAVCSTYALEFVRSLGADVVIDRKQSDPLAHAQPFEAIFDTSGTYAFSDCRRVLSPAGAFVTTLPSLALVTGMAAALFSRQRCGFIGVQSKNDDLALLGGWLAAGMTMPIAERFAVRDAKAALERVENGGVLGKVVIDVGNGFS